MCEVAVRDLDMATIRFGQDKWSHYQDSNWPMKLQNNTPSLGRVFWKVRQAAPLLRHTAINLGILANVIAEFRYTRFYNRLHRTGSSYSSDQYSSARCILESAIVRGEPSTVGYVPAVTALDLCQVQQG
ncbi:hypothetical protein RCL_jg11044.t1 [Rhizophagus clarus]|uniref:Uncharacterized protein n=1 Tax=Rhizophagus clarus TaxID=94130 RepID=A0A8H3R2X4_9GLOM|nr:hypothetical protein RCL_jg11044.t1 [Rhizophagus clarus]